MNNDKTSDSEHDHEALRRALRASLQEPPPSEALQARVLAHWQQRHARTGSALRAGPGLLAWAPRRWLGLAVLSVSLMVLAWCSRPDPGLDELMQLDVLSQIAIGEM